MQSPDFIFDANTTRTTQPVKLASSVPPPSLSPYYWSRTPVTPAPNSVLLRPRRSSRRSSDLLLDMPIAGRLALGFLIAAVIAAIASGVVGFQRSQSLTHQADFYQRLLQTNTSLTSGESFLQLMNVEALTMVSDAAAPIPSQETLKGDEAALQGLISRYNDILATYLSQQLIDQHSDELAILMEANRGDLAAQQRALASSTLRTWQFYRSALTQMSSDVMASDINDAQFIERYQAEPTNADAQSALRSLVRLDARLALSIQDAADVEARNQIIATIIAALIACLCIILVGVIISNTLIRRLTMLRRVTHQVERGHLESRALVIGRDEIADVSLAMNAMLDTIVGLLEEAQHQRDTLTGAAQQLFSSLQVMSAGELHISSTSNDDPVALLADAFNFTIGRLRRFITRTQTHIEQLETVSRQAMEYADTFLRALRSYSNMKSSNELSASRPTSGPLGIETTYSTALRQMERVHEQVEQVARDTVRDHAVFILERADQTILSLVRLQQIVGKPPSLTRNEVLLQSATWKELEANMQQLVAEIRQMQGDTLRGLTDIDHLTQQALATLQRHDEVGMRGANGASWVNGASWAGSQQLSPELIRLSSGFVQDIVVLARQINTIAQEMRSTATALRVDVTEPQQ